mmetsp:Transcript_33019/g.50510  ORF Transcript_33019/g.50510 Transcript_33019/m.50510 type:complete len:392 (-) Transcript_33019:62-1237(-)
MGNLFSSLGKDAAEEISTALKHAANQMLEATRVLVGGIDRIMIGIGHAWPHILHLLSHVRTFGGFCASILVVISLVAFGGIFSSSSSHHDYDHPVVPNNHVLVPAISAGWQPQGDSIVCKHYQQLGSNHWLSANEIGPPSLWERMISSGRSRSSTGLEEVSAAQGGEVIAAVPTKTSAMTHARRIKNRYWEPRRELKLFRKLSREEQMCYVRGLESAGATYLDTEPFQDAIFKDKQKAADTARPHKKRISTTVHNLVSFVAFFVCAALLAGGTFVIYVAPKQVIDFIAGLPLSYVGIVAFWIGYTLNVFSTLAFARVFDEYGDWVPLFGVFCRLCRIGWLPIFHQLPRICSSFGCYFFGYNKDLTFIIEVVAHAIIIGLVFAQVILDLVSY